MSYTVQILPRAQRQLAKLPAEVYPRVRDLITPCMVYRHHRLDPSATYSCPLLPNHQGT